MQSGGGDGMLYLTNLWARSSTCSSKLKLIKVKLNFAHNVKCERNEISFTITSISGFQRAGLTRSSVSQIRKDRVAGAELKEKVYCM